MDTNEGSELKINLEDLQREEEEALEDQIQQQQEVQNFLTAALEDFNYDDQSTINSSVHNSYTDCEPCTSYQADLLAAAYSPEEYLTPGVDHEEQLKIFQERGANNDRGLNNVLSQNEQYLTSNGYGEGDQLQVLYAIRVQEIEQLQTTIEKMKTESEEYMKSSGRSMLLMEAENNRLKISLQESALLIGEKSAIIQSLQEEVSGLNEANKSLQSENKQLAYDKTAMKIKISQHEDTIQTLQATPLYPATAQATLSLEHKRHVAEVERLQGIIDDVNERLIEHEKENKNLLEEMQRRTNGLEYSLAEKRAVVSDLTVNIDKTQLDIQRHLNTIDQLKSESRSLKEVLLAKNKNCMYSQETSLPPEKNSEQIKTERNLIEELDRSNKIHAVKQKVIWKLQDHVKKYESDLSFAQNRVRALEETIAEQHVTIKELKQEKLKMIKKSVDVDQISKLQQEIHDIEAKLDVSKKDFIEIKTRNKAEKGKNALNLEIKLLTHVKEVKDLKHELKCLAEKVKKFEEDKKKIAEEAEKLPDANTYKEELKVFQKEIETMSYARNKMMRHYRASVGLQAFDKKMEQHNNYLNTVNEVIRNARCIDEDCERQWGSDTEVMDLVKMRPFVPVHFLERQVNKYVRMLEAEQKTNKKLSEQGKDLNKSRLMVSNLESKIREDRNSVARMVEQWGILMDSVGRDKCDLEIEYRQLNKKMELQIKQNNAISTDNLQLRSQLRSINATHDSIRKSYQKIKSRVMIYISQILGFMENAMVHTSSSIITIASRADRKIKHIEMRYDRCAADYTRPPTIFEEDIEEDVARSDSQESSTACAPAMVSQTQILRTPFNSYVLSRSNTTLGTRSRPSSTLDVIHHHSSPQPGTWATKTVSVKSSSSKPKINKIPLRSTTQQHKST